MARLKYRIIDQKPVTVGGGMDYAGWVTLGVLAAVAYFIYETTFNGSWSGESLSDYGDFPHGTG